MSANSMIENFINEILPERKGQSIAGQHPDLENFKAWYYGLTSQHKIDYIHDNIKDKRNLMQSGFAKMICEEWASMYLNEGLDVVIACNEKKCDENEIVVDILNNNDFLTNINKLGEKYFALGLGATVVMPKHFYDNEDGTLTPTEDNEVTISYLDATRIYPITIDDGKVTEVAFIRYSTNKCTIQCHVLNGDTYDVWESKGTFNSDTKAYEFDYENAVCWNTNSTDPLFQMWYPNIVDNKHLDNPLGTSCFADCTDELLSFDLIFDKFYTEFKNGGKIRLISSELKFMGTEGKAVSVPLTDGDMYLPPSTDGASVVNDVQSELRVQSFTQALSFYANLIGKKCGLGDNSFEIDGSGRPEQTATASILKKKGAYRNVMKNENLATDRIKSMLMAIKYIYNEFVDNVLHFERKDIKISYDDNLAEDTTSKKEKELAEVNAGVMTIAEFRSHWYGEDEEKAKEFIQENCMLLPKYTEAVISGIMSPEKFSEVVYGDTTQAEYIKSKLNPSVSDIDYTNNDGEE